MRERRDRERRERAIETSPVIIIMIIICVMYWTWSNIYYVVANERDDDRTRFFFPSGDVFIHRYQNVPTCLIIYRYCCNLKRGDSPKAFATFLSFRNNKIDVFLDFGCNNAQSEYIFKYFDLKHNSLVAIQASFF